MTKCNQHFPKSLFFLLKIKSERNILKHLFYALCSICVSFLNSEMVFLRRLCILVSQVKKQKGDISFTRYHESLNPKLSTLVFFLITHFWLLIKLRMKKSLFMYDINMKKFSWEFLNIFLHQFWFVTECFISHQKLWFCNHESSSWFPHFIYYLFLKYASTRHHCHKNGTK